MSSKDPRSESKADQRPELNNEFEEAIVEAQESLEQVKQAVVDVDGAASGANVDVLPDGSRPQDLTSDTGAGIELLGDVDLQVMIELGRTQMLVEDVLKLNQGAVVELDKLAGDPVDVYVNKRLIARGEVLVLNDSFCIRISEIVADLGKQAESVGRE